MEHVREVALGAVASLCDFIQEHRLDIMEAWERRVRPVPPAQGLAGRSLQDRIPEILDRIAAAVREDAGVRETLADLPDAHAVERLDEGFDIGQAAGELIALRDVVVARIARSADRMGRMIADLLDLTRGRLGAGIPVSSRWVSLQHIARHVLEELEAAHPDREFRLSATGDFHGEWDPDRLAQLLANLGNNAVQHGAAEAPVDFVLRPEGDAVQVEVHNQGPPIRQDLLSRLFEPFRRGPGDVGMGLGLGLFIAREIVGAHGGRISVRSAEGAGTTFSVWLPRRRAEPRRT